MKTFNPNAGEPDRAVQAWQILTGKAMNRQTVTYSELARLMFQKEAQGVLAGILGHIAFYCEDNDLPPLTTIVVGKGRGTPGSGIPVDPGRIDADRERVYEYNWYNVYPPSKDELRAAYKAHA
jgi:hypothetical protein